MVAKTQVIGFDGAATVAIAAPGQFAAALSGFGEGATIELSGFDADTAMLKWKADRDGSGRTLKLTDATHSAALHFDDGVYTKASFEVFQFTPGVLEITYQATAAAAHGPAFGEDTGHPVFVHPLFQSADIAALV